jgi:hypothetical protein
MTEETFEQFKERVSQLNYEGLLGETVILTQCKDDSEERKKKVALLDDSIVEFDPFDEYSRRRQKGLDGLTNTVIDNFSLPHSPQLAANSVTNELFEVTGSGLLVIYASTDNIVLTWFFLE